MRRHDPPPSACPCARPCALRRAHRRAASAAAALLLACTRASALYGGYEQHARTFSIGEEYFLDEASFQPLPSVLEVWHEAELRPGGARGWWLSYSSLNTYDGLVDQELTLEYPFQPPWSWSFRYEQGDRPSGRYERAWAGMKARLDSGWSVGLAATPEGDKELVDLGLAFGHEALASGGVRLRWEGRVIFTDCWYNQKNDENASFAWTPLDLQLSVLGSWGPAGARSWVSLELDRDLPFEKTYGKRSDLPPDDPKYLPPGHPDQDYVFSFDNFEAKVRGLLKFSARSKLLARLVVLSADRGRHYLDPPDGDPATVDADLDRDDEYDLWLAGLEWWRRLDHRNELAFGYEIVDFDECARRPHDAPEAGSARDRIDHIIWVRHRRRLREHLHLTTSLWQDFHDRIAFDFSAPGTSPEHETASESKVDFALEVCRPGSRDADGAERSASFHLVGGAYIELDAPGAGGYVQLSAVF